MKVRLKDIAEVINGSTPSTQNPEYYDGDIIWITPKDLSDQNSKYIYSGERSITQAGYNSCSTKMIPENNILMSSRAPIGLLAINKVECCTNQGFKSLIVDKTKCNVEYLYYYLKYHIKEIESLGSGTTFKEVSKDSMEKYEIVLPSIKVQETISNVLSLLDNKIINNNKINDELESMAKTLYNYWFLQFEFPNEEGNPYKSSGGKMVWSEELKREIPEGWEVKNAYEIADIKTGKEDANHATKNGKYPFFTCANDVLRCDDYKFDGNVILIAGNGDFNVKHYNGKFNAYQRTYVITPHNDKYVGVFHLSCKQTVEKFIKGSNGSIVKFITLRDIQNIKILDCKNDKLLEPFNVFLEKIDLLKKENQELSSLRDFLLPLLMNGQVTFKDK